MATQFAFLCFQIVARALPPPFQSLIHPVQLGLLGRRKLGFEIGHASGQNLLNFGLVCEP